jgi:hypothetical protein
LLNRRFEIATTPETEQIAMFKKLNDDGKKELTYIGRDDEYNKGLRAFGEEGIERNRAVKNDAENYGDFLMKQMQIKKMKEQQEKDKFTLQTSCDQLKDENLAL